MKLESYQRVRPTINLTALIDVLFILVVFVMLAANFDRIGALEVALPGADAQARAQDDAVVVVVPREGPVRVADVAVADRDLEAHLRGVREAGEERAVTVVADRSVPLERATRVLDAAARAGFSAASIATRGQPGGAR